ncbi:low molecular weight phosphatase family protein [Rathayibacter sp. AY1E8]|uniref:arsenate-mycothiol transferase ArsC n=1 Tax=Rathayibacter sp. AY1E8 TaxID=2080555 RepID=UPI00215880D9|nr:hypothetical protein [Rathayibacter sp. AY1E8]
MRWIVQAMLVLRLTVGAELGAAGVFEVLAGDRYTATTAGLSPADTVNPAIAATVAELGLDISDRTPRAVTVEDLENADIVVAMKPGLAIPATTRPTGAPRTSAPPRGRRRPEAGRFGRYGDRMDDDSERHNLVMSTEIINACIRAIENPEKLFRVCASVSGGRDDERAAIAAAFGTSDVVADAILDMQVRRFTPRSIEQMRAELARYDRRLAELGRP